jgi:type I restriction enzyme S subunit
MAGETWVEIKLSEIMDVEHGFAFPGANIREEPPGDVLLTPGNFAVGGGFKSDKFKYFDGQVPEDYVLHENDLIVTMTDLSKQADTLGYPALVPKSQHFRYLHNQRLGKVVIRDADKVDMRFISYLLRTPEYRHEILASATGTTVKHTSPRRILAFNTLIPPLPEQRAIAYILGTLDDKIELNRRTNETLEAITRALFHSWFVAFDPVRRNVARRGQPSLGPSGYPLPQGEGKDKTQALPSPFGREDRREGVIEGGSAFDHLFPDSFENSELGEIPKGWEVGPILATARLLSGGTPKTDRPEYWNGGIPWASAKDVSQCGESFLVETERTITARGLEESATQVIPALCSIVVARGATTGRMVILGDAMAMNQTCYALSTILGTPFALYCHMRHEIDNLVHAAHGSVFDTITTSTFVASKVVLPPQPLLEEFEERVNPLFRRVLAGTRAVRTLAALRATLLPKLISGELRVRGGAHTVLEATV